MIKKFYCLKLAILLAAGSAWAQADEVDLYDMSLEELMNIEIVSASKKSESLFDAPLSATVITKEEIANSGATSIMEALRLAPGVIVREQNNGTYDIHIRGLDNVPPNTNFSTSTSVTTLVMIDNRPVFNYLQGGTFWTALPVDLVDVDRIEIVRGPSSTLYGPNAVSGVINIITRGFDKEGLNASAAVRTGTQNTQIVNGRLGYKFNDKLSAGITGSYNLRGRDQGIYMPATDTTYYSPADILPDPMALAPVNYTYAFPNHEIALDKHTVNGYVDFNGGENSQWTLSLGEQGYEGQVMFMENGASFSTMSSNTYYANLRGKVSGLSVQAAFVGGTENPGLDSAKTQEYKYSVGDLMAEYELPLKGVSIKPGIAYRKITYDYSDKPEGITSLINGKVWLETFGLSLRTDYTGLDDKLRLVGGVRLDKTTYPDKWFMSYQAAPSFKINDNHMIRGVVSRSYRSTFIYDAHMYSAFDYADPFTGDVYRSLTLYNRDLKPINSNMIEFGYRAKLADNLHIDVEAYHTKTKDFVGAVTKASTVEPGPPMVITTPVQIDEVQVKAVQKGVTMSANYMIGHFQIKPFVTMQKTTLLDYSPWYYEEDADPVANFLDPMGPPLVDPAVQNVNSGLGTERDHKFTPKFYGGGYVNYTASKKFSANLSSYWFSPQTFYHSDNTSPWVDKTANPNLGVGQIDKKVIMNAHVVWSPIERLSISGTVKNIFGDESREYYISDLTERRALIGIAFKY